LSIARELQQTCFIECKASRADFLRDHSHDGQLQLCLMERERNFKVKKRRPSLKQLRQSVCFGKFKSCVLQPMANLHYVLAPSGSRWCWRLSRARRARNKKEDDDCRSPSSRIDLRCCRLVQSNDPPIASCADRGAVTIN